EQDVEVAKGHQARQCTADGLWLPGEGRLQGEFIQHPAGFVLQGLRLHGERHTSTVELRKPLPPRVLQVRRPCRRPARRLRWGLGQLLGRQKRPPEGGRWTKAARPWRGTRILAV